MADQALFDQVGEVVRGSAPRAAGPLRVQVRSNGVKVWYGDAAPPREHFEAQLVAADIVTDARVRALEIGWHAEHPREADNQALLDGLRAHEPRWRAALGDDAVAGVFLGRTTWRRISETWLDPDLDGPDVPFDIGVRLVDYISALQPHRAAP